VKYVAAVVPRRGAQRREIRRRSVESSPCALMFASATPTAATRARSRARERYSPKSTGHIPTTLYRRESIAPSSLRSRIKRRRQSSHQRRSPSTGRVSGWRWSKMGARIHSVTVVRDFGTGVEFLYRRTKLLSTANRWRSYEINITSRVLA
jgi:hypothetical protein